MIYVDLHEFAWYFPTSQQNKKSKTKLMEWKAWFLIFIEKWVWDFYIISWFDYDIVFYKGKRIINERGPY